MLIRFLQRKRAPNKRDRAVLKEPVAYVGSAIWPEGDLRTAAQIDAAQDPRPPQFVFKIGTPYMNHHFYLWLFVTIQPRKSLPARHPEPCDGSPPPPRQPTTHGNNYPTAGTN